MTIPNIPTDTEPTEITHWADVALYLGEFAAIGLVFWISLTIWNRTGYKKAFVWIPLVTFLCFWAYFVIRLIGHVFSG